MPRKIWNEELPTFEIMASEAKTWVIDNWDIFAFLFVAILFSIPFSLI